MLPELTIEEFATVLDDTVGEFLADAGCDAPPFDAIELARRSGMEIAVDSRLVNRARTIQMAAPKRLARPSILLRPEPRPERRQWAVAHEIGEQLADRIFARLSVLPEEAGPGSRERVANLLARRLLLPTRVFGDDARQCDWDLLALKQRYSTASHELLARRMLDFAPRVIITVFDQGELRWRQGNLPGRAPPLSAAERACLSRVRALETAVDTTTDGDRIQGWPVTEPQWQREILRTERLVDA